MHSSLKLRSFSKIVMTVLATIFFAMPGYTEELSANIDKSNNEMIPRITLVSNIQGWEIGKDINLELKIDWIGFPESESFDPAADLILQSSARGRYCAPINVMTGDSLNGPNARNPQKSTLIPISLNLKPNKLKWGVCGGGLWPNYPLFETVPAGKYELYLEMEIESEDTNGEMAWIVKRSNKVNINLQDKRSD